MQEHFPIISSSISTGDASSPSALFDAVSHLPCTDQGSTESFTRTETSPAGVRIEIFVQGNTDAPVRSSTSGSAVLAGDKTAPERISGGAQRAETLLSPTPRRGPPAQPCLSLPGFLISQSSSWRFGIGTAEPSPQVAMVMGGTATSLRCPRGGTRRCPGSSSALGRFGTRCASWDSAGVRPPSSVPPSDTSQGSVLAGLAGAAVEREGDAGVSPVVSFHFPSFPFCAFLFSFLTLPRPVAGPAPLPSDVHGWWQEESGACRAGDKSFSCTRD